MFRALRYTDKIKRFADRRLKPFLRLAGLAAIASATAWMPSQATPFTTTVPGTTDEIPGNYPEAGGIVLVLLGDNGNYYFQISNPSEMFVGFQNSGTPAAFNGSPTWQLAPEYTMQCGLVSCEQYFGGGVQAGWVRFTAWDGDTSADTTTGNNFDVNDITLRLNGTPIGNWSDPVTQWTDTPGTGLVTTAAQTGFGASQFDTGWFDITNPTLLNDLMINNTVLWTSTDADPDDNFWDFTIGNDADTSTVPERVAPGMTATKTPREANYTNVGDTVTYDYYIRNVGTVYIELISVFDDQIGTITCPETRLDPGEDMTCDATDTISQDDLDNGSLTNNVTITGVPQAGSLGPVGTSATVPATAQTSSMSVTKSDPSNADGDGSSTISLNDVLTYTVTMNNTGTVSQTNVVVTDGKLTPSSISCARVLPGDDCVLTGTYTVDQDDVDAGTIANTGEAVSDLITTAEEDTVNTAVPQTSGLSMTKTANETDFDAVGDVLTYDYVVTNNGNVTVTAAITVADDKTSVSCPALPAGGLLPTASITCTSSYSVTQDDLNAGSVTNLATASSGGTDSPQVGETVTGTQTSSLVMTKTANETDFNVVGDVLTYDYVVTNTGNTTVTAAITVADDKTSVSCPALPVGGLLPSNSITCTSSYSVTQDDLNAGSVTNLATASSGGTDSPQVGETVTGTQTTSLAMTKTANETDFDSVGDILTYDYVVTNNGNVTITAAITVADDKTSVSCPALPAGGLLPTNSITCTSTYSVTQDDLNAGSVTNLATASAGGTDSPQIGETVTGTQTSSLTMTKTANETGFDTVGDVLTYDYVVTNNGNVTITDAISVADDKTSVSCPALPAGGLLPTNSITCTSSYSVTQDDLNAGSVTNLATASAGGTDSPQVGETVTGTQTSGLSMTKTANETDFDAVGDVLTYDYVVTNTGNTTVTAAITVADDKTSVSCPALPAGGLLPTASITCTSSYSVTQDDLNAGSVTNLATASSGGTDSPQVGETVTGTQTSGLSMTKTANETDFDTVGDVLTYDYVVTNTGNTTVTAAITVADDKTSVSCPALPAGGLLPTNSITCTSSYSVTQDDLNAGSVTNLATASSGGTDSPQVGETVTGTQTSGLSMTKTANETSFDTVGDVLTYDYVVTNTGNTTVTAAITVADDKTSVSCPALPAGGLLPTASITCTSSYSVTQDDLNAGSVTNLATASSGGTESPQVGETVTATQSPSLSMTKTASPTTFDAVGDMISYDYVVTNDGNTTVTAPISVADDKTSVSCPALPAGGLLPTASITCTATYSIIQADLDAGFVTNLATATGGPATSPQVSETATADQMPELSMVKTALTNDFNMVGDVINYEYAVLNTGNTTITAPISVSDDKIASVSCPALPAGGLAPNTALTCTATYSVTQADINAGFVTNLATSSDGTTDSPQVSETVTGTQTSALSMTKTASPDTFDTAGDIISYSYVVTNAGNVTVTAPVSITDDKIASVSCPALPAGGLLPGGTLTCTASYSVTQDDVDAGSVTNLATASDGTTTSPQISETATANQAPALSMTKTANETDFAMVGDILTYDYVVTNSGNVTVTAPISVSDDKIASVSCPALPAGGLVPGASLTCTASYSVTQADMDAGSVTNLATATDGTTPSPQISETVTGTQTPSLSMTKTATPETFDAAGDVISYSYIVTNSGNTTVTAPVSVTDDKIALVTCPALPAGGLLPTATLTCTASYTVTQDDVDAGSVTNLATSSDGTTTSPQVSETATANQAPALSMTKTANETDFAAVGDILTYDYVVTNSGNITVTDPISVSDDKIAAVACPALPAGGLLPGASLTCTGSYSVTQEDIDAGSVTNLATATDGTTPSPQISETVSATQTPALTVTKTADSSALSTPPIESDTITYTILAANTGNVTLTSVTVTDSKIGGDVTAQCTFPTTGGTLNVGETATCVVSYAISQDDIDEGYVSNSAVANASDPDSNPVSDTSDAGDETTETPDGDGGTDGDTTNDPTVSPLTQSPAFEMVKTATNFSFELPGDTAEYQYVVTNTGNVTLTEAITITDNLIPAAGITCPAFPAVGVAPGLSYTCAGLYTVTQADLDAGSVTNIATADDGVTTSVPTSATIPADQDPALTIIKTSVDTTFAAVGDILTYDFEIENTGNLTRTGTTEVVDDKIGTISCFTGNLVPDGKTTCSAPYTVTQADLDAGSVTNSAYGQNGSLVSAPVQLTITADQSPSLSMAKTSTASDFDMVGDVLTYEYRVENTGNVTISGISVSDDKIATVNCPVTTLAPTQFTICSANYTVTQADVDAGSVTNNASATGNPSGGTLPPVADTLTVTADQTPSLSFEKIAQNASFDAVGDTLTYQYIVENTGNVTISNVSISDTRIAVVSCPQTTLLPAQRMVCSATDTVSQADLDAGFVTNDATVTGDPTGGTLTPPVDTQTVTADQTSTLGFEKIGLTTDFDVAGDVLSYEYIVTNTGNVTLTSAVSVTDDKIASVSCPALPSGGLFPGSMITCSASYTVTQADVDAGSVVNNASASSGTVTSTGDTVIINAIQTRGLSVVKTASTNTVSAAGDIVMYDYIVTNTGNVTATSAVMISDDKIASVSCPALPTGGLLPGASLTCTAQYVMTQADIDAGGVTNLATATSGATISPQVSETVIAAQAPALTVSKTALTKVFADAGDVLSYEYLVRNTGNTTIVAPISINDDKIGSIACPALPIGGLAPNGTLLCAATYNVTQADVDAGAVTNLASATDGTTTSPTVSETATADQMPSMEMVKTATDVNFTIVGDQVTYEYVVTNTGNTSITAPIVVTDNLIPSINCPALPAGGLQPNDTLTCTGIYIVTQQDLDRGSVTNLASATDGTVTSPLTDETIPALADPAMSVVKTPLTASFSAPGDVVSYRYTVINTGNLTLTGETIINDDKIGVISCFTSNLAPTQSLTCEADYTITQADIDAGFVTNQAFGQNANQNTVSPVVDATIDANQTPSIALDKRSTSLAFAAPGDVLTYEYDVTNTGNTTIVFPLSVTDDRIADVICPALPASGLVPGATLTCSGTDTVTQADIDAGSVSNIATATDGVLTSPQDSVTVGATQTPSLEVDKRGLTTSFAMPGDTLAYEYILTNTGNTTLTGAVSVTDDRIASVTCPTVPTGGLTPGAQITCTAEDTVTQADIDGGLVTNIASARIGGTSSVTDTVTVDAAQTPQLRVIKTADDSGLSDPIVAGDQITYTINASNVGNVSLSGVVVTDSLLGGNITNACAFPTNAGELAVGEEAVCVRTYTLLQSDIDAEGVENTATASATAPDGSSVSDTSDAGDETLETTDLTGGTDGDPSNDPTVVRFGAVPSLAIQKSAVQTSYTSAGDVLSYEYQVTNTGNVTLTAAIEVADDKIASVTCPALPASGLAPSENLTCTADYTVTQADVDAGSVTNIASASTGTGADRITSPEDTVTVDAAQAPDLALTKSVSEPRQLAGPIFEAIYTLTLTNSGNTTLTGIALDDDLATALAPATVFNTPSLTVTGFSGSGGANPNYDGVSEIALLSGNLTLPVGETATITITAQVDITAGAPISGNTGYVTTDETPVPFPSDDVTVTPGDPNDRNPATFRPEDTDGDGVPDNLEFDNTDRDGDGINDAEDYDPTGYFYCEENGQILSGGGITVVGAAGSNSALGTLNNITIVRDGSDGFFQFYVTQPGTYTIVPTYPTSGLASTDRVAEAGALDVSSVGTNPVILGSSEFGSTGRIADFSAAANAPFYTSFDIEMGDPSVLMNNFPLKSCGVPAVSLEKTVIGVPERQPDGRLLLGYQLTATNTGETVLNDVQISDDLSAVFGPDTVEVRTLEVESAPTTFSTDTKPDYDGQTVIEMLEGAETFEATSGASVARVLHPGESASVMLELLVTPDSSGMFMNNAMATAMPPQSADPASGPNAGQPLQATAEAEVEIAAISKPDELLVTKTARPSVVQIGDTVRYQISVTNETGSTMTDLRVVDTPPAGFAYVAGSASLQKSDGAVLALEPDVTPGWMAWTLDGSTDAPFNTLATGETLTVNLSMVGGANTEFGELVNRAYVEDTLTGVRSSVATAVVEYIPEPTFDCTPVIGHVYDDVNRNGYQDDGESGLPGVRIATLNGDLIRTDQYGRYHIPCASIPDSERGSNLLLKVDARTLPLDYVMTTRNPLVVRATRGKFVKMNFGAAFEETVRVDVSAADFATNGLLNETALERFQVAEDAARVLVIYRALEGEDLQTVRDRMAALRKSLSGQYNDLTVEAAYNLSDEYEAPAFAGPAAEGPRVEGKLRGDREIETFDGDASNTERVVRDVEAVRAAQTPAYVGAPEIEISVDALHVEKALHVTTERVLTKDGDQAVAVTSWWNYPTWVDRAEVRVFAEDDSSRAKPLSVEPLEAGAGLVTLPDEAAYRVVVRVYDEEGRFDETSPRLVREAFEDTPVSEEEAGDRAADPIGANSIAVDTIPVNGATVRVYGRNVGGETANALGQTVFIDAQGQFVAEAILPNGQQIVDVTAGNTRILRDVDVKTRDIFATGLAEITIGQRNTRSAGDDDTYVEGRAAFYVRGRLSDRYRITATADTGEAAIEDLFDNLDEKDARNLLRRLDPDRYYPVYGDDSTITEDAPTSGRFYVRVERDDDYALWGNYQTDFSDTEFARIERTLYGAKAVWDEDGNPTALGDARSQITAFVAEPGTRSARDELRGTGGSIYYLRNADLSIGSEIVRIETRDVVSGIVLQSVPLIYGVDYDIDYLQGRILLTQPLNSTADDGRLFSDGGISGNPVFVTAEYEYTSAFDDGDEIAFGLRGSRWFTDAVKGGFTWARDAQAGETTELVGADLTLQLTGETYLKAEIAMSEGSGFDTYRSVDGGFDYVRVPVAGGTEDPMAWLLEGATDLRDLGFDIDGKAAAYYRHRDAGFAGYAQRAEDDVDQYGASLEVAVTEAVDLKARVDVIEGGFSGERKLAEASIVAQATDTVTVETGLSWQDDRFFEDSLAVGARANVEVREDFNYYLFGQVGIDGDGNADLTDRVGVGANVKLNDSLSGGVEVSTGAGGAGANVTVRHSTDEHSETYLTYDLPTGANLAERGGAFGANQGGLTVGAKRRYSDSVSIYGEERVRLGQGENGQSGVTHAYGVDYQPTEDWTLGVQAEVGTIDDFDRRAVSVSAGYAGEKLTAGSQVEVRFDENRFGGEDLNAVLVRSTVGYQANEELRLQGKVSHANTTGNGGSQGQISFNQANFTEASIAAAYRPIYDDRLNVLAKAVYLSDTSPADQRINGNRIDYKQKSAILSIDATYDLTDRCSVGGKIGRREGEVTDGRDVDDFFESSATLYVARADCNISEKWEALGEVRRLELGDGVSGRDGALLGVFRQVGEHVKVGGGITLGGVDDDYLTLDEERNLGTFLNVVADF